MTAVEFNISVPTSEIEEPPRWTESEPLFTIPTRGRVQHAPSEFRARANRAFLPWFTHFAQSGTHAEDPLSESDFRVGLTFMETGHWVAVDSLVGDYGEGDTCAEAVQDLVVSLLEDRELLREHETELVPRLRRELDTLNRALRDEML